MIDSGITVDSRIEIKLCKSLHRCVINNRIKGVSLGKDGIQKEEENIKRRLISRDIGASTAQDIRLIGQVTNYKICNSILTTWKKYQTMQFNFILEIICKRFS